MTTEESTEQISIDPNVSSSVHAIPVLSSHQLSASKETHVLNPEPTALPEQPFVSQIVSSSLPLKIAPRGMQHDVLKRCLSEVVKRNCSASRFKTVERGAMSMLTDVVDRRLKKLLKDSCRSAQRDDVQVPQTNHVLEALAQNDYPMEDLIKFHSTNHSLWPKAPPLLYEPPTSGGVIVRNISGLSLIDVDSELEAYRKCGGHQLPPSCLRSIEIANQKEKLNSEIKVEDNATLSNDPLKTSPDNTTGGMSDGNQGSTLDKKIGGSELGTSTSIGKDESEHCIEGLFTLSSFRAGHSFSLSGMDILRNSSSIAPSVMCLHQDDPEEDLEAFLRRRGLWYEEELPEPVPDVKTPTPPPPVAVPAAAPKSFQPSASSKRKRGAGESKKKFNGMSTIVIPASPELPPPIVTIPLPLSNQSRNHSVEEHLDELNVEAENPLVKSPVRFPTALDRLFEMPNIPSPDVVTNGTKRPPVNENESDIAKEIAEAARWDAAIKADKPPTPRFEPRLLGQSYLAPPSPPPPDALDIFQKFDHIPSSPRVTPAEKLPVKKTFNKAPSRPPKEKKKVNKRKPPISKPKSRKVFTPVLVPVEPLRPQTPPTPPRISPEPIFTSIDDVRKEIMQCLSLSPSPSRLSLSSPLSSPEQPPQVTIQPVNSPIPEPVMALSDPHLTSPINSGATDYSDAVTPPMRLSSDEIHQEICPSLSHSSPLSSLGDIPEKHVSSPSFAPPPPPWIPASTSNLALPTTSTKSSRSKSLKSSHKTFRRTEPKSFTSSLPVVSELSKPLSVAEVFDSFPLSPKLSSPQPVYSSPVKFQMRRKSSDSTTESEDTLPMMDRSSFYDSQLSPLLSDDEEPSADNWNPSAPIPSYHSSSMTVSTPAKHKGSSASKQPLPSVQNGIEVRTPSMVDGLSQKRHEEKPPSPPLHPPLSLKMKIRVDGNFAMVVPAQPTQPSPSPASLSNKGEPSSTPSSPRSSRKKRKMRERQVSPSPVSSVSTISTGSRSMAESLYGSARKGRGSSELVAHNPIHPPPAKRPKCLTVDEVFGGRCSEEETLPAAPICVTPPVVLPKKGQISSTKKAVEKKPLPSKKLVSSNSKKPVRTPTTTLTEPTPPHVTTPKLTPSKPPSTSKSQSASAKKGASKNISATPSQPSPLPPPPPPPPPPPVIKEFDLNPEAVILRPPPGRKTPKEPGKANYTNALGEVEYFCPVCLLEDLGTLMISCEKCGDWYHGTCVGVLQEPPDNQVWFCTKCARSAASQAARRVPIKTSHSRKTS